MNQTESINSTPPRCLSPVAELSEHWCYSNILDMIDDGVIVANSITGTIVFCNAAADEMLRTLSLEASYSALADFMETKKLSLDILDLENKPHQIMHNNRIIEFSLYPLPDQSVCIRTKDITEKKRLESIAQTVNTMDNLGFIFSGIRHEIGNPLNSIKMTNSVLQKNIGRFSRDDICRYIERTAFEIGRMEYLLKSLKNFSMFEKIDCSPHGINDFLSTLLGLIAPDFERKNISIRCEKPNENIQINIDPRALHQAILNILTNAADAVSGKKDAAITISTTINGRLAWINITDNGCGLTDDQIKMLFQPFYTNKAHGNGLGLVITQKLLTMMQASLDVSSRLEEGTTVRIGLPLTHATTLPENNH